MHGQQNIKICGANEHFEIFPDDENRFGTRNVGLPGATASPKKVYWILIWHLFSVHTVRGLS